MPVPSAHWLPSIVYVTGLKSRYRGNWYGEIRKGKMFMHRNRRTERQGEGEEEKARQRGRFHNTQTEREKQCGDREREMGLTDAPSLLLALAQQKRKAVGAIKGANL